jgi:hypothetical protein
MPPETQELVKELVELVARWQDGNSSVLSDLASEVRGMREGAANLLRDVSVVRKELELSQKSLQTLWDKFDKCYDNRQERYNNIKKDVVDTQQRRDMDICSRLQELAADYEKFKVTGFVKTEDFNKFKTDDYGKIRDRVWWFIGLTAAAAALGSILVNHLLQHVPK